MVFPALAACTEVGVTYRKSWNTQRQKKKSPQTHAGFSVRTKRLKTTKIPANTTGVKFKIKIKKNIYITGLSEIWAICLQKRKGFVHATAKPCRWFTMP